MAALKQFNNYIWQRRWNSSKIKQQNARQLADSNSDSLWRERFWTSEP